MKPPEKLCLKCEGPLEIPDTGRPPIYCGPACRQAAAYELQRLQRRLEGLEGRLSDLRGVKDDPWKRDMRGRLASEQRSALRAEIADGEARLRALLAEPRGKSPSRSTPGERDDDGDGHVH